MSTKATEVHPLDEADVNRLCAEGLPAARLYGASSAPSSAAELRALFAATLDRLEPSPIIFEFLHLMRAAPIAPAPLRPIQQLLIRAAVEITPGPVRVRLGLTDQFGLRRWQRPIVARIGALSDKLLIRSSPAVQSCRRLGLPDDYLDHS